jgi:peptidoglycan/xylan/chitin deacetylase (PgdA/CDA1 family)
MVSVDVEASPEHAAPTAELLRRQGIPTTWFAASRRVQDSDDLGRALARTGEIGAQTPDQAPVAGLPPGDQRVRLARAVSELERWGGTRPVGFRPSEEAFDVATVDAWHREGGSYLVGLNHARSASPEMHPVAGAEDGMVLLPRLVKDDYNVFVQDGALRSERLVEAYALGMGKLYALGGLALVSAHTQILDSDNRRHALLSAAMAARAQDGWWVAQGQEIATWWRARSRARVRPEFALAPEGASPVANGARDDLADLAPGGGGAGGAEAAPLPPPDEVAFTVEASEQGLDGGWLDLVIPEAGEHVPLRNGVPVPFETTPWGLRLPLGPMEPGGEVEVRLVAAPPSTGG